jgi:anti-anti-sigma regulatory factor
MPGCSLAREVIGTTATYRISGRFDGACAWDLSRRLQQELLAELLLDFSQVDEFVDYGVAVLANVLLALDHKCIHLRGVRQHQLRLFKYFGVDAEELAHRGAERPSLLAAASEVG